MSADGFGIFGAAVLALAATPVLIGGAAITGTVYGSVKLTKHIAQQRRKSNAIREQREAEQRAFLAEQEAEERERIQEIVQSYSGLLKTQKAAMDHINKQMIQSYTSFVNEIQEEQTETGQDMGKITADIEGRKKVLFLSWEREIDTQAKTYADSLHNTFAGMKTEINQQVSKFNELKTQMQENAHLQEFASSQLKEAEAAIHAAQMELGSAPDNAVEEYNKAVDYFNKEMYEPAFGIASSIVLECYDYLEEGISNKEKKYALMDLMEARIVELKAQIESMKFFQFEYKNEMYETDLSMYEPVFAGIISRLERLDVESSDIDGKTLPDFTDIQDQLTDIELDIQNCTKLAVQKLLSAYTENDTASDITAAMEEQGYDMDGYAYEGGEEGNPIHVNFINRISENKVTVILSPKADGIHVNVHDYGADGTADVQRQDEIRHLIEETLNIQIHCSGRGTVSSHTKAADLTAVENMNIR